MLWLNHGFFSMHHVQLKPITSVYRQETITVMDYPPNDSKTIAACFSRGLSFILLFR